jgi:hypothetical protein
MSFMASILPKSIENKQTDTHVNRFLKESKISSFLHQCNIRKEAGISFYNWTQRGSFDDIRSCHASS